MKLIDKDAVLAEIENIRKHYIEREDFDIGWNKALDKILSIIDTLEVKEVDLEKEIELVKGDYEQVDVAWNNDFDYIAKHFFELGVNASNPLTWKDIKLIWNITDEMDNMPEEEFYKEVLKRFKTQKGE
jgi:hypothetical protein